VIWPEFGLDRQAPLLILYRRRLDGVRQYIKTTQQGVAGVAAKDGKLLWKVAVAANRTGDDSHADLSRSPGIRHLGLRRGLRPG